MIKTLETTGRTEEAAVQSALEQLGLDEDKIIRAGYPRCLYQKNYERVASFDHDVRRSRQLPEDTRLAAYVPTYRNENGTVHPHRAASKITVCYAASSACSFVRFSSQNNVMTFRIISSPASIGNAAASQ